MGRGGGGAELFEELARDWWAEDSPAAPLRALNQPRFAFFDRYVDGGWTGQRVLDVGCGGGFTTEYLASRGAVASGVDVSPALVRAARRHAAETGLDIRYAVGAGERLPFADGSFSVVTCLDVLEHVPSPGEVVREIRRVLAPGGVFLFDTINRTWRSRLIMIWGLEHVLRVIPRGTHDWNDFITPAETTGYLGAAGLTPLGRMAGLFVVGRRPDGSFRTRLTRDLSCTYLGAARR
ncbi:bifunctional 2-polyprenyl-6-hydroxyphenol methylase/3-demethylubiquinol 3-O-methyltransferase UbiG [Streptomyces roseifaciens]|uniref:bifunctional 2-polyprenyl-6-hydroxyphenol methylase/3-demethylubiquinol 3-O-methyltransferase UbiG n=1 Tax=Streptomyces roseifaciens TaxID=1488406 RepID=UPI000717E1D7|nr:bifunctional 2-polyprenyl-6-hydroxyphenol methylase/3-demethylubiquinol 3-O-methyltransferase UbiG [Streptomyces roseifaciens]